MPTTYSESSRVDTASPRNDDGPSASDLPNDGSDDNSRSDQRADSQVSSQDLPNDESITEQDVARFQALFHGYTLAYGQTKIGSVNERGKVKTENYTIRKPITSDLYARHLRGQYGLGVFPIGDDGENCLFGALDIDDIKINHIDLERRVQSLGLPLVVCRSKSGGAHLYLCLRTPITATLIRATLEAYAAQLGLAANTEIFPKQSSRANPTDVGNYINLPYYGQMGGGRYAIHNGVSLSLVDFLDLAEQKAVSPEALASLPSSDLDESDTLWEAPPCLVQLRRQGGFPEGSKRNGMFNVGVYLRKRYPDDWELRLDEYNRQMCEGMPLRSDEIEELKKSLRKKSYNYTCKQQPINTVCQRQLCRKRQCGVATGTDQEDQGILISDVTCYRSGEVAVWGVEIDGVRLLLDAKTFLDRSKFNVAVANALGRVPIHTSAQKWLKMVDDLMSHASVVEEPEEASPEGQLWEWIERYLSGAKCSVMDSIAVSGAFLEDGMVHFRGQDLFDFLDRRRIPYRGPHFVWQLLKQHGGTKTVQVFRPDIRLNIWHVPSPRLEELELEVPTFNYVVKEEDRVPF